MHHHFHSASQTHTALQEAEIGDLPVPTVCICQCDDCHKITALSLPHAPVATDGPMEVSCTRYSKEKSDGRKPDDGPAAAGELSN